jgi:hypothetical protein
MLSNGVSREDARVSLYPGVHISSAYSIITQLVYVLLNMAGSDQRQDDLFSTESLLAKGRSALKGLKVLQPSIRPNSQLRSRWYNVGRRECIHATYTSSDADAGEPFQRSVEGHELPFYRQRGTECRFTAVCFSCLLYDLLLNHLFPRPQDVIIFMIGGTTYEEARTITLLNQEAGGTSAGTRLLLGGTCVHNSSRYIFHCFR